MPNISMIEKVVQQVCAIDYLVSKYTSLLINQFIQRQTFLIDEDISRMELLSSSKECSHWPPMGCTKGFPISSTGRGPGITTVSKIRVYEIIINISFWCNIQSILNTWYYATWFWNIVWSLFDLGVGQQLCISILPRLLFVLLHYVRWHHLGGSGFSFYKHH